MVSGEAANGIFNFSVFGLNRLELEPTIYRNRDDHARQLITPSMGHLKIEIHFVIYTYDIDSPVGIHHWSNLDNIVGSKLF